MTISTKTHVFDLASKRVSTLDMVGSLFTPPALPEVLFVEERTEFGYLTARGMASTSDGYYVSFVNGSDAHLSRLDRYGSIVAQTEWDFAGNVSSVQIDTAPSVLWAAVRHGTAITVGKFTSTSSFEWLRTIENISPEEILDITKPRATPDGGVVVGARYSLVSPVTFYPTVFKFTSSGDLAWECRWQSPVRADLDSIEADSLGNVYAAYIKGGGTVGQTISVAKIDSSGALQWIKDFIPEVATYTLKMCRLSLAPDGSLYILADGNSGYSFLTKLTSSGSFVWARRFTPNLAEYQAIFPETIDVDSSGTAYVTFWALKTSPEGFRTKFWISVSSSGGVSLGNEINVGNLNISTHGSDVNGGVAYGRLHFAFIIEDVLSNVYTDVFTNLPLDGSGIGEYLGRFPLSYRPFTPNGMNIVVIAEPSITTDSGTLYTTYHSATTGSASVVTGEASTPISATPHEKPESPYAFTISAPTDNATIATLNLPVYVEAGQTLQFGTTNVTGASADFDTYIRLLDAAFVEVDDNDDFGDGTTSYISYTTIRTGMHVMKIGGYASNTGSGFAAWLVDEAPGGPGSGIVLTATAAASASSTVTGVGPEPAPTVVWDTTRGTTVYAYTNQDAVATRTSTSSTTTRLGVTTTRTVGKWYIEFECVDRVDTSNETYQAGFLAASTGSTTSLFNDVGATPSGSTTRIYVNNFVFGTATSPAFTTGDVIGFAVDIDAGGTTTIDYYLNNVFKQTVTETFTGNTVRPVAHTTRLGQSWRVRGDSFNQIYSPPSGYTAWGG